MWGVLYRALFWAGSAALGYFANDIGDGVTRYIPNVQDKDTGKISWFWMIIILLAIAAIFIWIINFLFPKKYQK